MKQAIITATSLITIGLLTACSGDSSSSGSNLSGEAYEEESKEQLTRLNWVKFEDPKKEFQVQFSAQPEADDADDSGVRTYTVDAGDAGDFEVMVVSHGDEELWETRDELIKDLSTNFDNDGYDVVRRDKKNITANDLKAIEYRLEISGYYVETETLNGREISKSPLRSKQVIRFIPHPDQEKTYVLTMNTLNDAPDIEKEFLNTFKLTPAEPASPESE